MDILGTKVYTLSIEHSNRIEVNIYDHGCNVKVAVKKALREGKPITICGKTIWRENHEVTQGPNYDFIWAEDGHRILVEEILKIRTDSTNDLKIIKGRQKYMNYDRYMKD